MANAAKTASGSAFGGLSLDWLAKSQGLLFAVALVAVIIMMIVPLPSPLVDLMLTLNIALSVIILLVSLFNNDVLSFSSFPTILMVTTIFRLALNVSSTRIILSGKGSTLQLVKSFGSFVVGGNYIVGFVVFLILVLIQFLVITKGAERIGEVTARFTLDAMPIKGMAIDADLNAGAITQEEATQRRLELSREADFYGSMDGATKFVKNDTIAGIIITVINLLGGIAIGVIFRGEGVMDALAAYALFTVGSGLCTQLPSLMISTATGIVVTRSSSDSSLGQEISMQLFSNAKVIGITAGLLIFLGTIPGLPKLSFFTLGIMLAILAYVLAKHNELAVVAEAEAAAAAVEQAPKGPEDVSSLLAVENLELEIGYNLIPLVDTEQGGDLLNRITLIRRQIAIDLGLVVPSIRIRDNIQLQPSTYVFKIKGSEYAHYEIMPDHYLAMLTGEPSPDVKGIEVKEPAFGLPAFWITPEMREKAEIAGYAVVDPSTVIATHLTELIKRNAHEILGRKELQQLLDSARETDPLLVDEVVPKIISNATLLKVLQNLLYENVSVKYLTVVLDAFSGCHGITDTNLLTEIARQALSRHICKDLLEDDGVLRVISIDPQLEQSLSSALQNVDGVMHLAIDPASAKLLMEKMTASIEKAVREGHSPIILCSSALRLSIKQLANRVAPHLAVLSYQEIPANVNFETIGIISLRE